MDDFIQRDIKREIAHHDRLHPKQPSQKPPAPEPTIRFLDQVPDKPLTWLWPGRIPQSHLTLLDAAPPPVPPRPRAPRAAPPPTLSFPRLPRHPASGIPGLARCLPALVDLARQTNCAILLTRSLRQSPVDPFHAPAPTSPLLQAARSRLLLAPDPSGDGHQLLLTTKHALCTQPVTLAYDLLASEVGIPTIHSLGQRDHDQLTRLCTGPIRSPYRQAILRFLQHSDTPRTIPDILQATSYDREAGRKMLVRMKMAGELVSPARGLYTTPHHPCLLQFTNDTPSVPNVSNVSSVSSVPSPQSPALTSSPQSEV